MTISRTGPHQETREDVFLLSRDSSFSRRAREAGSSGRNDERGADDPESRLWTFTNASTLPVGVTTRVCTGGERVPPLPPSTRARPPPPAGRPPFLQWYPLSPVYTVPPFRPPSSRRLLRLHGPAVLPEVRRGSPILPLIRRRRPLRCFGHPRRYVKRVISLATSSPKKFISLRSRRCGVG